MWFPSRHFAVRAKIVVFLNNLSWNLTNSLHRLNKDKSQNQDSPLYVRLLPSQGKIPKMRLSGTDQLRFLPVHINLALFFSPFASNLNTHFCLLPSFWLHYPEIYQSSNSGPPETYVCGRIPLAQPEANQLWSLSDLQGKYRLFCFELVNSSCTLAFKVTGSGLNLSLFFHVTHKSWIVLCLLKLVQTLPSIWLTDRRNEQLYSITPSNSLKKMNEYL